MSETERDAIETLREALLTLGVNNQAGAKRSQALEALDRIHSRERELEAEKVEWISRTKTAEYHLAMKHPWTLADDDYAELLTERDRYREALERIEPMQQFIVDWFRQTGVVFNRAPLVKAPTNDSERWEEVAFRIYSYVCEIDGIARNALSTPKDVKDDA